MKKKKVGLITWHYYNNFGSALQAYALQSTIENLGYQCKIINYRNPRFGIVPKWKKGLQYYIYKFKSFCFKKSVSSSNSFLLFQKEYLNESKCNYSIKNISVKKMQAVVCGSDQIWAPNVLDTAYLLDFIDRKDVKKISYASSIGLNEISDKLLEIYKNNLNDFHFISVRESVGGELLKNKCNIDSIIALDPTFLLPIEEYRKMQSKVKILGKFIFCYFLNSENTYREKVKKFAKEKNYTIVGFSTKKEDSVWMQLEQWIGPREFLWLIDHSEGVFTDSYHGTIFSLLFHKDLWHFMRFSSENPICQNSRIEQLEIYFNIKNRIVLSDGNVEKCEKFDYDEFEEKLKKLKGKSLNFLKESLE